MRKRNRRRTKHMSVWAGHSMGVGVILVSLVVVIVLNVLADSSCSRCSSSIGAKERELKRVEEELERETSKWDAMVTIENLQRKMEQHGIKMDYPSAEQYVRMGSDGKPLPRQLSVLAMRNRSSMGSVADNRSSGSRRKLRR